MGEPAEPVLERGVIRHRREGAGPSGPGVLAWTALEISIDAEPALAAVRIALPRAERRVRARMFDRGNKPSAASQHRMDAAEDVQRLRHVLKGQARRRDVERSRRERVREVCRVKGMVDDSQRCGRFLLVGERDHAWRNVNARGLRTAGRHLPREVAAAAPDVEQSPAAHVAAEVSVRRSKELIPVIVAPGCLPLRVPVRGQVPCFPY